jgi:glycosyltransferase involved in cell wall biosynthesis
MTMRRLLLIGNSSAAFLNHHLPLAGAMQEELETHVAVVCDRPDDARRIEERGITVHPLHMRRKTANPVRVAGEALAVRRIIASVNPDVVNAITIKCLLVAALAMRFPYALSPRLVGTITGLGYMFSGDSVKRRLLRSATTVALRLALPKLRHTLVFSNTDDRRLFVARRVGRSECACVVPVPGVDTEVFVASPEPVDGFRVVLPARMLWEKGVGEFVAAARLLRQRGIDAEYILAGGVDVGNPAAIDVRQLREWDGDGAVRWLGHQDDMPALLASANVVCLPSYYREGFPRALAEAMACGRAVVTTDVPGCRDAVLGLESGLLVPPRDATALADALQSLWNAPEMRRGMGRCGRDAATTRFSQKVITMAMKGVLLDTTLSRLTLKTGGN